MGYQIIYKGTTKRCLPKFVAPEGMNELMHIRFSHFLGSLLCFSSTHWQDVPSTKLLIDRVIVPFYLKLREKYNYPKPQYVLLLLDIWHTHVHPDVIAKLEKQFIKVNVIEPGYTSVLQVMDLVVNKPLKDAYKFAFNSYCVQEVRNQMSGGKTAAEAQLDLCMCCLTIAFDSFLALKCLKELIPKWAQAAWDQVKSESIKSSFESVYSKCFTPAFIASALAKRNDIYPLALAQDADLQMIPDDHIEYVSFVLLSC